MDTNKRLKQPKLISFLVSQHPCFWLTWFLLLFFYFIALFSSSTGLIERYPGFFNKNPVRVKYVVYTSKWKEKEEFQNRLKAIQRTWAEKVKSPASIMYVNQVRTKNLVQAMKNISFITATETYDDSPVTYGLKYLKRTHQLNQLDWIILAVDATYIIPNNMDIFLNSLNASKPYYLGHPLRLPTEGKYSWDLDHLVFNSLACIILSRPAAETFLTALENGCRNRCLNCSEDLYLAYCLREEGVVPMDTRNSKGQDVFHVFQPGSLVGNPRSNFYDYTPKNSKWYQLYSLYDIYSNTECCSRRSISFHFMDDDEMEMLHHILYGQLDRSREYYSMDDNASIFLLNNGVRGNSVFPSYFEDGHKNVRHLIFKLLVQKDAAFIRAREMTFIQPISMSSIYGEKKIQLID